MDSSPFCLLFCRAEIGRDLGELIGMRAGPRPIGPKSESLRVVSRRLKNIAYTLSAVDNLTDGYEPRD